ncbi:MAG: hypothetical protein KGM47_00405 [Acidobacteriota bacterium]|nr:hypothetical protein [Acidobacteriota bacterium]
MRRNWIPACAGMTALVTPFSIPSFPRRRESTYKAPPAVNDESRCRVWLRRFYHTTIWTKKKKLEKFNGGRHNPVKRSLVREPGEWEWPGFRFYYLEDFALLGMDVLP